MRRTLSKASWHRRRSAAEHRPMRTFVKRAKRLLSGKEMVTHKESLMY